LKIEDALSLRPRTLGELANLTGISVQGVLRHLSRLEELGLVEQRKVKSPRARRVYFAKGAKVGDYSTGGLTVVKATESWPSGGRGRRGTIGLEGMAGELMLQRRRIKDEVRRLGRMIDDLADGQETLSTTLGAMKLSDEERLMLEVLFTEETVEEGIRVLASYYGFEDRRSIDKALATVKQDVGK